MAPPLKSRRHGLPAAQLRSADGHTAEVCEHGAHLTSWKAPDGTELLFVSDQAVFQPPTAIRGGVPVCWPQFSDMGPLAQAHGFARNSRFDVLHRADDAVTCVLRHSDATREAFPHAFELTLKTQLLPGGALRQEMRVKNLGEAPMEFTAALHTYFRLQNGIAAAAVRGLKGCTYLDNLEQRKECVEDGEEVRFEGEVDRVYVRAPDVVTIADGPRSFVRIAKRGFSDAVVWNPAAAKAQRMADFGDEEWRDMVCVEVAQAGSRAVTVVPGGEWVASQELSYHQ